MASLAIGISRKLLHPLHLKRAILDQSTDLSLSSSSSRIRESELLQTESKFLLIAKRIFLFLWISICSILVQFGFLSASNREKVAPIAAEIKSIPSRTDEKNITIKNALWNEDELLLVKQLVDGYYMRGKALLAASRPHLAKKVRTVYYPLIFPARNSLYN